MTKKIFHFPHVPRILSAWALKLVNFFVLLLIILNLFYPILQNKTPEHMLRSQILLEPFNSSFHEALGKRYISFNMFAAKTEFALAEETGFFDKVREYDNELKKEYLYWEKIYGVYPDYTYAAIKLSEISYFRGDIEKAKKLNDSILKKNPYDRIGLNLQKKLNKN